MLLFTFDEICDSYTPLNSKFLITSKRCNCAHLPEEHFFLLFAISIIYQNFFQHRQRIKSDILNKSSVKYFPLLALEAISKLLHKPNLHKHPPLTNGISAASKSLSHLE